MHLSPVTLPTKGLAFSMRDDTSLPFTSTCAHNDAFTFVFAFGHDSPGPSSSSRYFLPFHVFQ
jgi:hypothetical protein